MLKIWTGAKEQTIKDVILSNVNPNEVGGYKVYPIGPDLPTLQAGDLCLACGAKAVTILQSIGMVPKNRKVDSLRGEFLPVLGGKAGIIVTYDPGILAIDATKKAQIEWDISLSRRWLTSGSISPKIGKYKYVDDFAHIIEYIEERYEATGKKVGVVIDLETLGFDPYARGVFIVLISVTVKEGESSAIRFTGLNDQPAYRNKKTKKVNIRTKVLRDQVVYLCSSPKIALRGANFKFDMGWLKHHWGVYDFSAYSMDTTLVGSLLDENRSNSLNNHTKIYVPSLGGYDDTFNNKHDKSRMDLVPDDDLLEYGGGDTDACYRVSVQQKRQLMKDKKLRDFYTKLLHPAAKAIGKMERRGIVLNIGEYECLREEVTTELKRLKDDAFALIPVKIRNKYSDNLSLTRAVILQDFLFSPSGMNLSPMMYTAKNSTPSVAMEHLEMLAVVHEEVRPFVKIMGEYNSAAKTLSTYITGFMKHIRSDGKFHPSYMLHRGDYDGGDSGTVSGRSSAKDPAFQTIPKHTKWAKPLRRVYVAPPGHKILIFDFSQGELRIAACLANEPTMIKAYKTGLDLHAITASVMCNMSLEEFMAQPDEWRDDMRSGGKAGNFGLLYGMGWRGFTEYARKTYGVYLEDHEAQAFRTGFFQKYKGLVNWHDECRAIAHSQKQVRSPLGRIRHLPLINGKERDLVARQERQAINFGPQSVLSDLGLFAMGILDQMYPELWMWGFTHDAIATYVPEDEVSVWYYRIKEVMENLPVHELGWHPQLKFLVDGEMSSTSWAEVKKYKG